MQDDFFANKYNTYANTYKDALEKLPGAFNNLSMTVTNMKFSSVIPHIPSDHLGDKIKETIEVIENNIGNISNDIDNMKNESISFAQEKYTFFKAMYDERIKELESESNKLI